MKYIRLSHDYNLEKIKEAILNPKIKELEGAKVSSLRLKTFANKGWTCAACGLKATFFAKEHQDHPSQEKNIHWNLYGIDSNNNDILFTHDHIKPRSKGGLNDLSNTQTMCSPCNAKKADHWIENQESNLE